MTALSQNDLEWFACRLAVAVYDTNRETPEMSASELRAVLRGVDGAEELTISYASNGNQLIHIGDKTLEVGPMASNQEIAVALQNPFIRTENTKMSITGAAPVTLSIKQMIEQSRQTVQAAHQKLTTNAAKVSQAAAALDSLGDDLGKEGDDLLAMVGQYKNDLGAS